MAEIASMPARFRIFADSLKTAPSPPYSMAVFWADFKAGLILLLVEIPFAMGIGVVSGMGIPAALYCLVIVAIVTAIFGGTRAMMSGPAVAVAVIVAPIFASGEVGIVEMGIIAALAGGIQILLGLTGIGRLMAYLPYVVLTAFISGIGLFLIWSQNWTLFNLGMPDIAIAGICLAVILFWPRRFHRIVPGQLVGVSVAWAVSVFLLPGSMQLGVIPTGLPEMVVRAPSLHFLPTAIIPALLIALISSVYTLMIAQSVDSMTGARHNPNRQLAATGIANIVAGLFGAVPGSGQFGAMGTVVAGGRTVVAGIVVAVLTAAFILGVGPYLSTLPMAAISSVLIWMGWELVDWRMVRRLLRIERRFGLVFAATCLIAALGEPLVAVVFGFVAAGIGNAAALERVEMDSVLSVPLSDSTILAEEGGLDPFSTRVGLLAFRGSFSVASSQRLAELLEFDIRGHEVAIFDLSGMTHTDDSAAYLLKLLLRKAGTLGIDVIICGVPEQLRAAFDAFDVFQEIPETRITSTREQAQTIASKLLAAGATA
ncbi:MAG: SulP family inorganic anion transporter [Rhodobacteraceae bacterium]|nr:SulP family inorganic anion transporter [Paracoccaceae bacterium]